MKNIYVISGVTGMTGSELSRQYVSQGHYVIGFDNFFASSIETVKDLLNNPFFIFVLRFITFILTIVLLLCIQSIFMR